MKKALLVLFAAGWFLCGFAQEIQFETTVHDFGLVNYNDPAVFDFVFTNTGTEPLIIKQPTSQATILSWPEEPVLPKKKGVIKVKMTTQFQMIGRAKINQSITVSSNAKSFPKVVLRIKGNVLEEGIGIKFYQKNGYWGCEDDKGKTIIPYQYEKMEIYNDNRFFVQKSNKWGVIDKTNHTLISFDYDELMLSHGYKTVILAKKNKKWGLINWENKAVTQFFAKEMKDDGLERIKTLVFFQFPTISSGSDLEEYSGKWGAISTNGDLVIPPIFESYLLVEHLANDNQFFEIDCNQLDPEKELKGYGISSQKIEALQKIIKK